MLRPRIIILLLLTLLPATSRQLRAQGEPEGWRFGGWEFVEINHDFGRSPFFGSFYFEHDNLQYRHFDCWYTRTILGVKLFPWFKTDVAYDFVKESSRQVHRAIMDVTATLKEGPLKLSLRERYLHSWIPAENRQGNELRSRLKAQYAIPHSRFSPYLAIEVFTWKDWKKTRHYVACDYDITRWMQLEAYYLYYTHKEHPSQHILGIGFNFYL
ncbi:MAG: DUF2490 domain-containing protein [Bacteroidaceae bacterium]|nr:DUF2490 domain-containing protein [Bacteroidaceae bacterium]